MDIVLLAAVADNGVIGKDNALSWHMPADLRFFHGQIRDSWLLTGRRSWESPQGQEMFPGREGVILLTRQADLQAAAGTQIAHSIEEALALARRGRARRLCVLGGAKVYAETIDLANQLTITEIHGEFAGDARFPDIDAGAWQSVHREDYPADAENPYPYSFVFYRRRS